MLSVLLSPKILPRLLLGIIAAGTLVLGVVSWYNPPALYPDPAWGFQVIRSMEHGGRFNELLMPDVADIVHNNAAYLTWWSPGQYLIPWAFKFVFHLNYGQAAVLTTVLASLLGISGFFYCFVKVGFSRFAAAVSVLLMAVQQFYFIPYVFYNGGEILIFAFTGWFFYGCLGMRNAGWWCALFICLSGCIGFLCKSAFLWIYAAGVIMLWLKLNLGHRQPAKWLTGALRVGVPALLSLFCIYYFFLAKGHNPVAAHQALHFTWEAFLFPLASPLLAALSLDDIAGGLIYTTEEALFSSSISFAIIALCAFISVYLLWRALRSTLIPSSYKILVTVTFGMAFLFFSIAYLRQSAISYEGRHFRMGGLLLLPVLVQFSIHGRNYFKFLSATAGVLICVYSVRFLVLGKANNRNESAHGISGTSQQYTDNYSLQYLQRLDHPDGKAIFVFTQPELALEIKYGRVITLKPVGPDVAVNYNDYIFRGHAGPLYIYLPVNYNAAERNKILTQCFPGYTHFNRALITLDYELYWSL